MFPEILQLGPLHLRSYGTALAAAFLLGTWLSLREARRLRLDEDRVVTVILVTLIASVLGARGLYVMEHIDEFRRSWTSVLALWQGGLTLYGGIAAGTLAGLLASRQLGLPMWKVADAVTPALALGTGIGRIGCFLNGCCYGRPTTLPWGVVFPADSFAGLEFGDTPVHPSQLYFAAAGVFLFVLTWALRRRVAVAGTLFWTFILLFTLLRIPLDLTRAYEPASRIVDTGTLHVTESQVTSVLMLLFSALMLLRLRREARRPEAAPDRPAA